MFSYGVLVPYSRLLFVLNPKLDDRVDKLLVITPSGTESALKIEEYEEVIHSKLIEGWYAYKTIGMMFTTDHRSVTTVRLLNGSQLFGDSRDVEAATMIARFVMLYEAGCTNVFSGEKIPDYSVKIHVNDKEEKAEEEEEICVICQKEFEAGEVCHTLECGHWYHKECIDEWLKHKSLCPVCRDKVFLLQV